MENRGKFIVFEGLDGSGKTTQIYRVRKEAEQNGIKTVSLREPTDNVIGKVVRDALKKRIVLSHETLAHLFAADRIEHINKRLLPELSAGTVCICDRYIFSSLAFQGAFLPFEQVLFYNKYAAETLMPDLTVFIDLPPAACMRRVSKDRQRAELFENEESMALVYRNYTRAFERFPEANIVRVNGEAGEEDVFAEIWKHVGRVLGLGR
jgi:dTMP kinase